MPTVTLDGPDVPAGWKGSVNKLLLFLRENWGGVVAAGQQGVITGQIGGTEPTTNIGIWVDGKTIKVWDDDKAKYVSATDTPVGTVIDWAGADNIAIPENYLACDGATYDGTDDAYVDLFEIIGLTWGGTGSLFKVPDSRGRIAVGNGQGDYALNTPSVAGKMATRTTGSYFGFEWIQKQVKKVTGAPSGQYGTASGGVGAISTTYTGCQQPAYVVRKLIRYK